MAHAETSGRPAHIWYQSFVDVEEQRVYIEHLRAHLATYADPGFAFEVHGISPPDRHLHPLTEFRCAAATIRNAIRAAQEGYDAFVIGHFQEPGLIECRASVDIPVIGLGEATMLHACTLGRRIGLVTINPIFVSWHNDQIVQHGLAQRVVAVRALRAQVETFIKAFDDEAGYEAVKADFVEQLRPLLDDGIEVVILAGGLPMVLFAREPNMPLGDAVLLNGVAVVAKAAEMAVKLHRMTGVAASRRGRFALAPPQAIAEFLENETRAGHP